MKSDEDGILASSKEEGRKETSGDCKHHAIFSVENDHDTTIRSSKNKVNSLIEISPLNVDNYNGTTSQIKSHSEPAVYLNSFRSKSLNDISQSNDVPDFRTMPYQMDVCDQDFKYTVESCGDSVSHELERNNCKCSSSEEKYVAHEGAITKKSSVKFSIMKAVHIDIPPGISFQTASDHCGDSESQNMYEIRVIKDEISVGNTIFLEVSDHASPSNYSRIHASTTEEFSVKVNEASALDFEGIEKRFNKLKSLPEQKSSFVSKTALSFNNSLLKSKFILNTPKLSVKWKSDPSIFMPKSRTLSVKRTATSESFTQTEKSQAKRTKIKSRLRRAAEFLCLSFARICI